VKYTAYEKDSNSPLAELYLKLYDYIKICIGNSAKVRYNENTTTFYTKDGGYCYIKAYEEYIHIGWTRGKFLDDKYSLLFGSGKTIRGQRVVKLDKTTRESIRYYVEQTLIFLIEHNELMKMRKR
jgi:pectate lyase